MAHLYAEAAKQRHLRSILLHNGVWIISCCILHRPHLTTKAIKTINVSFQRP